MIVVIADDFTGAAELGGIGLRYNLTVEVNTIVNSKSEADLLVIATDTRSMPKEEALATMLSYTKKIKKLEPELIYKKVDSVLRGFVAEELAVQLEVLKLKNTLLVPANPALGRTIRDGVYYINDQPIHLTDFANDPEFPAQQSEVVARLGGRGTSVHSALVNHPIYPGGITVGNAANDADLSAWAVRAGELKFVAGASGFFNALLRQRGELGLNKIEGLRLEIKSPTLIVSGTAFEKKDSLINKAIDAGIPICFMPAEVMITDDQNDASYVNWCSQIVSSFINFDKAIIAIDPLVRQQHKAVSPQALRVKTAIVVKKVFKIIRLRELVIEGGSTASAIFDKLGFKTFYPVNEFAIGVIRMEVENHPELCVTLKPGSYAWPPALQKHSLQ